MPGNRGDGFWDDFEIDRLSEHAELSSIDPRFWDMYENTVSASDTYAELSPEERSIIADDFMDMFVYGGYSRADQDAWLAELGLYHEDFDWDTWFELYDSVHG
jgi:hypothetical protein